ncbi:MAG: hypothetical protein ACP5VF_12675 [Acidobacteriota bacterium]
MSHREHQDKAPARLNFAVLTGARRLAMERLILPQAGHLWAVLHPEPCSSGRA